MNDSPSAFIIRTKILEVFAKHDLPTLTSLLTKQLTYQHLSSLGLLPIEDSTNFFFLTKLIEEATEFRCATSLPNLFLELFQVLDVYLLFNDDFPAVMVVDLLADILKKHRNAIGSAITSLYHTARRKGDISKSRQQYFIHLTKWCGVLARTRLIDSISTPDYI